jgi:hypothetical protein
MTEAVDKVTVDFPRIYVHTHLQESDSFYKKFSIVSIDEKSRMTEEEKVLSLKSYKLAEIAIEIDKDIKRLNEEVQNRNQYNDRRNEPKNTQINILYFIDDDCSPEQVVAEFSNKRLKHLSQAKMKTFTRVSSPSAYRSIFDPDNHSSGSESLPKRTYGSNSTTVTGCYPDLHC